MENDKNPNFAQNQQFVYYTIFVKSLENNQRKLAEKLRNV